MSSFVDANLTYDLPISESDLITASGIRNVYGIRALVFSPTERRIHVEYDASRLTKGEVATLLRNAGVRVSTSSSHPHV